MRVGFLFVSAATLPADAKGHTGKKSLRE